MNTSEARKKILQEVSSERDRQVLMHGFQDIPMRPDDVAFNEWVEDMERVAKKICDMRAANGLLSFYDVAIEEFYEVFAACSWKRRREELIQLAAVAVQMIEVGDIRGDK